MQLSQSLKNDAPQDLRILLLEDSATDAELIEMSLRKDGLSFVLNWVEAEKQFLSQLRDFAPHLVLSDYSLPGYNGLAALEATRKQDPTLPFIFVSGTLGEETAIEALHCGATDYVLKHRLSRLGLAVRRALREMQEQTKRKEAENALAGSERSYREIFESLNEGLVVCSLDGQLLRWNRAALQMFELPPEAVPQNLGDVARIFELATLDDHSLPQEQWPLRRLCRGEPVRDLELKIHRIDDSWQRIFKFNGALVRDLQDRPVQAVLTITDITQRKQLEAQFLQAQKMDAVGQLAGGVAHDFNNILAATMMHLELVRMEHQLAPPILDSLSELQQELQRAANLTRQLLVFSRRQSMRTAPLELNDLVEGLLKMLKRLLGENIEIQFVPSQQPLWVEGDAGMIEQVIMNLCVNARDAMPRGGRLSLVTKFTNVASSKKTTHAQAREGRFVTLKVTDTGCGMNAATLKRLFEPFFTTKEPGKGTGLGLATVYSIAKQHGGWINVESTPGKGSTFELFLPQTNAAQKPLTAPVVKPRGGSETILLVEDEFNVRRLLKMSLSLCGYEVLDAANGIEALAVWEQHGSRVRLLITDMVMPGGLTGLELAERVQQKHDELHVVIMTGYSPDLIQPETANPRTTFLTKPFDLPDLLELIRNRLDATAAPVHPQPVNP